MGFAIPVHLWDHLHEAGMKWNAEDGYFYIDDGDYQLTLEPLILDSGEWALALYRRGVLVLDNKITVDVKPRRA